MSTQRSDDTLQSSSPRKIRQTNAAAALQALFDQGRLSRAELARQLGLNRSSSGNIVSELTANALIREVPDVSQTRTARAGRPGILLELDPDAAYFLGVEIGVEHISTVLVDFVADVRVSQVELFDGRSVPVREAVAMAVEQAFDGLGADINARIEGFGLTLPAQLDRQGRVRVAPLLGWRDEDLVETLQNCLRERQGASPPVQIENDANAFAFGESYRTREDRSGVTLFLVIETGVGGGIVIDGKVFRGGHGLAGEIGHLYVRDKLELEAVIGLEPLMDSYQRVAGNTDVSLANFLQDVSDREPRAVDIAEQWARDLAGAVVAACRLLDPNRIVLGGSVAALYPLVSARVAYHVGQLQADTFPLPEIVVHDAPENGAAYGAACMLHRRFLSS